ncbi:MAG TPA: sigma-70 family RNA polymerase sigma factor [Kofleriaceae bacterium]|nr:sigma-70 family RNA polymerase sigma factor [Kofleriaceae bacterium]
MHAAARARSVEPIDELMLRRAQRGDERAWRDLIARFQQPVHALIYRLLAGRARHRVEDLTQETFVRVVRALPKFDPAGPATLSTWILTIATRLTLNEMRRPEPSSLEHEPPGRERTDASSERQRLGAAIAQGIAALPDAQRAVLVLREYHELDYAEIADVLELDVGTVKSRLSRARTALRDHLSGELGGRHE